MSPRPNVDLDRIRRELGSSVVSDLLDAQGLRHQCLGPGLAPSTVTTSSSGGRSR